MHPKSKKFCLIAVAIVILVALMVLCRDMIFVMALAPVLINFLLLTVMCERGFMDGMFGDEVVKVKTVTAQPERLSTEDVPVRNAKPIDYFPDTYIPSRNTGHIPYYENPLLEPPEMFPTYYDDTDTDIVATELRRIRDRQALEGAATKTSDHFKTFYRSEFADEENKQWWGNTEF